jgi:lipopolysaccharide biosynthesis regulator YciM
MDKDIILPVNNLELKDLHKLYTQFTNNNFIYMCSECKYKYKTFIGAKNCIHPYSPLQSNL